MKMNLTLSHFALGVGICGSLATPMIWGSKINEVNAVQDEKIYVIQSNYSEIRNDVKELDRKINALLVNNGINPDKLK